MFVVQDADQQTRLGVVHVLFDPRHGWACQGLLARLAGLESEAAQALGLLFSRGQAFGNLVPLAHLGRGASFGHAVVLLRSHPTGQRVTPAQFGFVGTDAGDLEQLAQAGFHLLFALARTLAGGKRRAVQVLLAADPLAAQAAHTLADVVQQTPAQLRRQIEQRKLFFRAQQATHVQVERATRHRRSPRPSRPPTARTARRPRSCRRSRSRRPDPRSGIAAR